MNKFIVGTFVSQDTPYEVVVREYLLPNLIELEKSNQLSWEISISKNYGSWLRNVAEKPNMILALLEKQDKDVLFLDADATIEKFPNLFNTLDDKYDLAFHSLDWKTWYNRSHETTKELLTGTMFFRNNSKIKQLLREWYETALGSQEWEQKALQSVIKKHPHIKIYELPIEYCYIKTLPDGREPWVKCEPYIVHHQVSRDLRRKIK